jgi:hypothetical protein
MSEEDFTKCFQAQAPPKMVSLIELIERAKRAASPVAENKG